VNFDLTTSWDLIHDAARGDSAARQRFADRYEQVAIGYFAARWRGSAFERDIEDATQDVFLDCLREGGALSRANPTVGEFRGFLHGVVRNVALRFERARGQSRDGRVDLGTGLQLLPGDESAASRVFDREWARSILRLATQIYRAAGERGAEHQRRVELLRLRFEEGKPIRDIAGQWQVDPAWLHHEFARARRDFKRSLATALGLDLAEEPAKLDAEVTRLWEALR
jgi:RNA polymerase sigma-70 factor (ECF subfamily)